MPLVATQRYPTSPNLSGVGTVSASECEYVPKDGFSVQACACIRAVTEDLIPAGARGPYAGAVTSGRRFRWTAR